MSPALRQWFLTVSTAGEGTHPALDEVCWSTPAHDLAIVRGFSTEQLAERAGIHRTYVAGIERGQRHVGLVNVARQAAALEVDLRR